MKKLLTLALALILAMGALGLVACGGDGATNGESMTKDEFITELARRETATFADTALHYATVDCKLIINIGDEYDGTYEQTCDIHYGTDQYEEYFAYTSVKKGSGNNTMGQQQRLFCADYLVGTFADMPADLLSAFKFEKDGDNLRLLCDTTYNGVKLYMEYKFDANGYLLYRKESQGDGTNGESVEFTVKAYNKTKDLEVQAFLTYLRGLEGDSYNNLRYATVSATDVEQIGSNPRTTDTGDFKLKYYLEGDNNLMADAEIRDGDGHLESTITVLGLSGLMSQRVEEYPNGEYAVKKVGSNYDVTAEIDSENGHISVHYVFDKDGYMVYGSISQGDEYMTEFTATAYNKEEEGGDTITYTVTSEQWDKAVSLYWTNVTYEFTDGTRRNKVELLADGSLHQYDGAWGEKYCIYRTAQQVWQVYHKGNEWDEDSKTHTMDYTTEQDYIAGNYGDDFGFMGHMLPTIRGRINEFNFDSANNQYLAENIGIPMTPEDVYTMNVIAKFENQKLVYVKFAAVGGSNYFEANFWNYGTTEIEFPDWMLNA